MQGHHAQACPCRGIMQGHHAGACSCRGIIVKCALSTEPLTTESCEPGEDPCNLMLEQSMYTHLSSSHVCVLLTVLCWRRRITVTICCPGPVATGSPDQPRSIYGGTRLVTSHSRDSKKRMSPARVAELIGSATYHKLNECWIARHPVLLMGEMLCQSQSDTASGRPPHYIPPSQHITDLVALLS